MRKFIGYALLAAVFISGLVPAASAVSIGFSSPYNGSFSVASGGTYSVDVVVSGLSSGGIVSAFDLDVLYDAGMLNVNSVDFGSWLGNASSFEVLQALNTAGSGVINFAAVSLLSDLELQALQVSAGGTVTLATLNFGAIADGSTALAFDWYDGRDVKGNSNEVIAGYVPEPGTILLMGSGLLALLPLRRRNQPRS